MPYFTASVVDDGLTIAFVAAPAVIVPLAWHAARAAPPEWRRLAWLSVVAFSLQVAAGLVWGVAFLANGDRPASTLGAWTPMLYLALLIASAATWTAIRRKVRRRGAILDYSMMVAALTCVAAAVPPGALWVLAGSCALLAAAAVLRGIDRPARTTPASIPGVSPAALMSWWAAAWTIAAGVGLYGALAGDSTVLIVALAAIGWIGPAGMVRAVGALRAIRAYYLELDEALFRLEQANDRAKQLSSG